MRSFLGVTLLAFQGQSQSIPVTLCGQNSRAIPWRIDWSPLWLSAGSPKNLGVIIDMNSQSVTGALLDKIVSIYIDNLASTCPVYVYFPDTGFTVAAPPNTATWYPVITGQKQAYIYAEGLTAGFIPTTAVYFANMLIQPYSDTEIAQAVSLYLASPSISRGNTILNSIYGTPALGDQTAQYFLDMTGPPNKTLGGIWNTPLPSGFLYVTSVSFANVGAAAGLARLSSYQLESLEGDVLYNLWFYIFTSILSGDPLDNIYQNDNMQLKLDATKHWQLRNTDGLGGLSSGACRFVTNWTYQP